MSSQSKRAMGPASPRAAARLWDLILLAGIRSTVRFPPRARYSYRSHWGKTGRKYDYRGGR